MTVKRSITTRLDLIHSTICPSIKTSRWVGALFNPHVIFLSACAEQSTSMARHSDLVMMVRWAYKSNVVAAGFGSWSQLSRATLARLGGTVCPLQLPWEDVDEVEITKQLRLTCLADSWVLFCKRLRSPWIDSFRLGSQAGRYGNSICRTGPSGYRGWRNRMESDLPASRILFGTLKCEDDFRGPLVVLHPTIMYINVYINGRISQIQSSSFWLLSVSDLCGHRHTHWKLELHELFIARQQTVEEEKKAASPQPLRAVTMTHVRERTRQAYSHKIIKRKNGK